MSDYSFGEIKVGESRYTSDLVVFEDEVQSPWVRKKGHLLTLDDVQWALERSPDAIIVGTGSYGRLAIAQEVMDELSKREIGLVASNTTSAVETYNKRARAGEHVAACLHLTC